MKKNLSNTPGPTRIPRDEFEEWLKVNYTKYQNNKPIQAMFGVSSTTIYRIAKKLNLERQKFYHEENMLKAQMASAGLFKRLKNSDDPEDRAKYERLHKKRSETRKELVRSERLRERLGLPRRTKIKVSCNMPKLSQRYYLKTRGYIMDEENRIAYWTEDTKRARTIEKRQRFYRFAKIGTQPEAVKAPKPYVRPAYDGNINFNV